METNGRVQQIKVFNKTDYGAVTFGVYAGKPWSQVPKDYLVYICSDECRTSEQNKAIAKKELLQRDVLDGQIEMF